MDTAAGAAPLGGRVHSQASRLVARPWFWATLVLAIGAWPFVWALRATVPPPLPVLGQVPRFELVDEQGQPFGSRELEGRVWVGSFIFTRCPTICPAVTQKMTRVQSRTRNLAPSFHLVSFSVDPAFDTPEVLAGYARSHHASPRLWSFLTGPSEEMRRTVVEGLKVAVERGAAAEDDADITHGSHLVLVDARGRVRGYYASGDEDVVDRVVRDAGLLVNRPD